MAGSPAAKSSRRKANVADEQLYDRELDQFPPGMRWRSGCCGLRRRSLPRDAGAGGGKDCSIDLLIDHLVEELRDHPYELVPVAGGWQHRTRPRFAEAIRASSVPTRGGAAALSEFEAMVLMAVGYFQPVTRGELSKIFGKEISRDTIGNLRGAGLPAPGHAARRRARPTPM
nr:SMC-Scp complex subunit ScpB [Rhizobium populisoli]